MRTMHEDIRPEHEIHENDLLPGCEVDCEVQTVILGVESQNHIKCGMRGSGERHSSTPVCLAFAADSKLTFVLMSVCSSFQQNLSADLLRASY